MAEKEQTAGPMLDFPSMDPVRSEEQVDLRRRSIEQGWQKKAERDKLSADKKKTWERYQEYVTAQGGVDVSSLPWNSENWYEGFTAWEAQQAGR